MYFDGASADLLDTGTIDTQEIAAHGALWSGGWKNETGRIQELCEDGKSFGIKGFIRMGSDFEIMICDFSDGLEFISQVDLVPWNRTAAKDWLAPPPGWIGSTRPRHSITLETLQSGAWHDFKGLPGVALDYATFQSMFDPKYTSIVAARRGVLRHHYRAGNISKEDSQVGSTECNMLMARPPFGGSGIN